LWVHIEGPLLAILIGVCVSIVAEPAAEPPQEIVENYCAASRGQEQSFQGASMDVEIQASLPKLKKQGGCTPSGTSRH